MQMICPGCRGELVLVNEKTARCPLHGGEYEVLFIGKDGPPPVPPPLPAGLAAGAQAVAAEDDLLPLAAEEPAGPPRASGLPRCVNHPDNDAVVRCDGCGLPICATCVFEYPGIRLCPSCITKAPTLSPRRRRLMIAGYVLAVIPTFVLALLFGGALSGMAEEPEGEAILGGLLVLFGYVPAITGTCVSCSAADKRTGTPAAVWGAIVWNLIMLGILVLLSAIGSFM